MSISATQQAALEDWLHAAEEFLDFAALAEPGKTDQARNLLKEILRAENRVRAVNGFPPRMFSKPDSPPTGPTG